MPDTMIGAASRPLVFDNFRAKKGDLCTILQEQPDAAVGTLLVVMFVDGIRRFVRQGDVDRGEKTDARKEPKLLDLLEEIDQTHREATGGQPC